jgi:hypothetical protein
MVIRVRNTPKWYQCWWSVAWLDAFLTTVDPLAEATTKSDWAFGDADFHRRLHGRPSTRRSGTGRN